MLYCFVLALVTLEIEHGDRVPVAGQRPCEMIIGRSDATVAHGTENLLGGDTNPQAFLGRSFNLEPGQARKWLDLKLVSSHRVYSSNLVL